MKKLTDVEGIDWEVAERLEWLGIRSLKALLREGSSTAGRLRIGLHTGLQRDQVATLVRRARDLMEEEESGKNENQQGEG